jgi:hypothetical protein
VTQHWKPCPRHRRALAQLQVYDHGHRRPRDRTVTPLLSTNACATRKIALQQQTDGDLQPSKYTHAAVKLRSRISYTMELEHWHRQPQQTRTRYRTSPLLVPSIGPLTYARHEPDLSFPRPRSIAARFRLLGRYFVIGPFDLCVTSVWHHHILRTVDQTRLLASYTRLSGSFASLDSMVPCLEPDTACPLQHSTHS